MDADYISFEWVMKVTVLHECPDITGDTFAVEESVAFCSYRDSEAVEVRATLQDGRTVSGTASMRVIKSPAAALARATEHVLGRAANLRPGSLAVEGEGGG